MNVPRVVPPCLSDVFRLCTMIPPRVFGPSPKYRRGLASFNEVVKPDRTLTLSGPSHGVRDPGFGPKQRWVPRFPGPRTPDPGPRTPDP